MWNYTCIFWLINLSDSTKMLGATIRFISIISVDKFKWFYKNARCNNKIYIYHFCWRQPFWLLASWPVQVTNCYSTRIHRKRWIGLITTLCGPYCAHVTWCLTPTTIRSVARSKPSAALPTELTAKSGVTVYGSLPGAISISNDHRRHHPLPVRPQ
jgi:hypothetical protein